MPLVLNRFANFGILVAIDDHPELRAPVAEVIVADRLVAQELQRAIQAIADHGAADVAHVHRLGDVRGAVIDHVRARLLDRRHAETLVGKRRRGLLGQHIVAQSQIDESRAGDFRRLAQIVDFQAADDFLGHFARRLAQSLAQRHRAVGLIVAEFGVLAGAHLSQQLGRIVGHPGQSVGKSALNFAENVHG